MIKQCSICKESYSISNFYKESSKCKPCHKEDSKRWGQEHPEKKKEYNKKWLASKPENYNSLKSKKWRLLNPHKSSIQVKTRQSKIKQATPNWIDYNLVDDFYIEARYLQSDVDHIVPIQSEIVCGLHWEGNLQALSHKENVSKGNRYWPDMPTDIGHRLEKQIPELQKLGYCESWDYGSD